MTGNATNADSLYAAATSDTALKNQYNTPLLSPPDLSEPISTFFTIPAKPFRIKPRRAIPIHIHLIKHTNHTAPCLARSSHASPNQSKTTLQHSSSSQFSPRRRTFPFLARPYNNPTQSSSDHALLGLPRPNQIRRSIPLLSSPINGSQPTPILAEPFRRLTSSYRILPTHATFRSSPFLSCPA